MTLQLSKHWAKQNLPIFKVFADQGKHPSVAMDRPVCVVGRKYGVNLPLDAPQVSKYHALIVRDGDRIYLRDLASTNGVQVNGETVEEVELHDGQSVRVGAFTLRCASGFNGGAEQAELASNGEQLPNDELRIDESPVVFPRGRRTFLIGRRDPCDLHPVGEDVAPVHAVVFTMGGKRMIRDLNTPSGTYVNGEAVHQTELRPGDVLRVGETTMEYASSSGARPGDGYDESAAAPLDESRIPLIDDGPSELERSDAPLIAVAGEDEASSGTGEAADEPSTEQTTIEQRAEALLGGSSIVGEIFESHYGNGDEVPAEAPTPHAPANDGERDATPPPEQPPPPVPVAAAEVVEIPGAQASEPGLEAVAAPDAPGVDGAAVVPAPAIELVPAAGVPVPQAAAPPPPDADEKYVVPISELTLTSLPAAATVGEPLDDPAPQRDPRADDAGETIAGEEVITTLVDEIADRATTLKHAWDEHRSSARE